MSAYDHAIELATAIETIETAVSSAIEDENTRAVDLLTPILERAIEQWADLVDLHPDVETVRDFV